MKMRKKEMISAYIYKIMCVCACAALLTACSGSDGESGDDDYAGENGPVAVSFATEVAREQTRATTGLIYDLKGLQAMGEGFGVFAYLTDDKSWSGALSEDADLSEFKNFFMQNQQVTYGVQYVVGDDDRHYDWVYSPLKYWPNSTNNATARNISFFAYAPWADASASPEAGVINYVRDGDRLPHVIYKLGAPNQQVDLLWANCIDATRNGKGLITADASPLPAANFQKVPLKFQHALSAVNFYVQRVYDEPAYTGKVPSVLLYPTIYISKLELTSAAPASGKNALQTSGKLSLIDGTWDDDGTWVGKDDDDVTLTYDETQLNDTIRGTTDNREEYIRDFELDKWKWILDTKNTPTTDDDEWVDATAIPESVLTAAANANRWKSAYGLSEVERNLIKNNVPQMLLPRKVTLIPTLTYSMVVRDDALVLRDDTTTPVTGYMTDTEGHKYSRIVNTVEGNSLTLDLVAGKRYTVLIRVSAQHVSFELVSVVDWDFPMRYQPGVVTNFDPENVEHRLDEE